MVIDVCEDNRFEIIQKAKQLLIKSTNIKDSPEEMKVIDTILFRMWQMGWLPESQEKQKLWNWISVKDRLPEPRSNVLVFAGDHCIYTALFDGLWWLTGEVASYKVTYWMPLPEPPEIKDEH